ncbi:MAG: hypothetical protein PF447_07475, partial [Spirochaetaceae bacterium]|jgi:DNA excision repair protein ERCC-2|nr:hypothetical protein [Spirochaetaceae bacterium]
MVEAIHVLREEYPGHQMAFFPSFAYLNEAAELWRLSYDEPIILQRNSMDLQERQNMIDLFEEKGSHLIFAVIGGIFSEGLDLEGDKLSALSIVSVGLPSICLEREWIKEHYDKKNRHGFDYAYRYPGWNRILQAAGRLIRSETDRGIIQLLGRRFNTPFYRRMFPKHWGNSLSLDNPLDQAEAVASFRKEMHV